MNKDLRALFADLVQSLHQESDALVRGDADLVAQLAAHKNELLQRIAPLARTAKRSDLPARMVAQAKELNDRNALLLAPRLLTTRARLDALRQAGNPMVYGADGRTPLPGTPFARA